MKTDAFGGVQIEEPQSDYNTVASPKPHKTDQFGGVLVEELKRDQFGGILVPEPPKVDNPLVSMKDAVAAVLTSAGNVARAVPADIAAGISRSPEFAGNLPAAISGEPLPVDQALKDAADEGATAAATIGKISQGVAGTAPLLAAGFLPATAQKLMAIGFTAEMLLHSKESAKILGEEMGKKPEDRDRDKISTALSDLIQTTAFAPLAGKHGTVDAIESRARPQDFLVRKLTEQIKTEPLEIVEKPVIPITTDVGDRAPIDIELTKPQPVQAELIELQPATVDTANKLKEDVSSESVSDSSALVAQEPHESRAQAAAAHIERSGPPDESLSGDPREIDRQSSLINEWAQANNLQLPADFSHGELKGQGAEHEVFFREADQRAIKRTYPGTFGVTPDPKGAQQAATPLFYLQRLELMNEVFDADMRLEGLQPGRSMIVGQSGEQPSMVVSQPWVRPADLDHPHPSSQEIKHFMNRLGFEAKPGSYFGWERKADGVTVLDARPDNFIKTTEGVVPVDLVIKRKAGSMSAIGDPLTAAMPPIPAGRPSGVHASGRMPVAMERIVPGLTSVPEVMTALENIVLTAGGNAPIRAGRFFERARGIYKEFPDVIRLRQADNIPTAAHEVAHALSKAFWDTANSDPFLKAPRPVQSELNGLGRALYGTTKPAAGYTAEGWSEFVRLWLTTEDAARMAPETNKWFEKDIVPQNSAVKTALHQAREKIDVWRGQGAEGRAKAQMQEPPGRLSRVMKHARKFLDARAQVEEFEPLELLSKGYEKVKGSKPAIAKDPYLIATAKRGSAGQILHNFVERGTQDIWGNAKGPSLRQALAPVKAGQADSFAFYLWSRRALERWAKKQNPGMALEDAQYLKLKLETPEFQLAADGYYKWWDDVLDYYASASPTNAEMVKAIRSSSRDYVPLARIFDESLVKQSAVAGGSNPLKKMHGSGRPIRDIYQQSLLNAERIIARAHKDMVLESVFNLSRTEGMGHWVEEVPIDRVRQIVNIEQIRADLEKMGVDTTPIPDNELLTYFTPATLPKGVDPIMVRKTPGGTKWYQVPVDVFETLNGLDVARLGPVADLFLGVPSRAFKIGTTGLRASFALVTNPIRDFQTFMVQSMSDANPAARAQAYFASLHDLVRAGLGGKESPALQVFNQLGISSGQFLGGDIAHVRREAKGLFHGKLFKRVTTPVETLRELLSFTEATPRLAEMRMVGEEQGWKPGAPLTPQQAIAMTIAARRVTTDFSAGGRVAKLLNQAIPFYNPVIQGTRGFLRGFKTDQGVKTKSHAIAKATLYGLTLFTIPTLYNWWRNKDQEWYRQLPWRERYLYTNVDDEHGRIWQIPRTQEWGNLFMVAPEMLLDWWHTQDPRGASEGLQYIFETQNPVDYPVLGKIAKEQWQNRISFFDHPIVPRNQIDLPPGQQVGPYTTRLARWLGEAFPETLSPRRVDAAIRSYFGGVVPDLMDHLGIGKPKNERTWEPADFPVYGRLARRGGQFSAANQVITDFYDLMLRKRATANGVRAKLQSGGEISNTEALTIQQSKFLDRLGAEIRLAQDIADKTEVPQARATVYRKMGEDVREALKSIKE